MLAEAVVRADADDLAEARRALEQALGPEAVADAVAVAANFERMVRIADATGIPLDAPVAALTEDLRQDLGIDGYAAAAATPPVTRLQRLASRALRPIAPALLRFAGRAMAARLRRLRSRQLPRS